MYIYIEALALRLTNDDEVQRVGHKKDYGMHTSAYVSIRQHTSAYVSIRQHTACIRQHTSA